jgi:hypothetical protein
VWSGVALGIRAAVEEGAVLRRGVVALEVGAALCEVGLYLE